MRVKFVAWLAAAILLAPAAASAQSASGFYVEGKGGLTLPADTDLDGGASVEFEVDYDAGFNVGGAAGYAHSSGFRGELELGYQQSDTDSITIVNDGGFGVANGLGSLNGLALDLDGDISVFTGLANAYYDIDTGGPFTPFVGGGVGLAVVSVDVSTLGAKLLDDDDTVFAYQIGGGVSYAINPNLSLSIAYRYLGTSDAELTDTVGDTGDWEYSSHNILAGVRYTF